MHFRGLSIACLLGMARAAEPGEPYPMRPWIVTETRLAPDPTPIRASAVLSTEAWSDRSIATLADAFRQVPGAMMLESFGGFEPPRLSIRGSGIQSAPSSRGVALLFDQLPIGLADGSFNSALMDPLLATRIDVHRGSDGWRTAPGTLGGALDLRGFDPGWPTASDGAVRAEAGSFGARRVQARGATVRADFAASAAIAFSAQDGFRLHSEQSRRAGLVSFRRRLGGDTQAAVGIYHVHSRYEVPGPLTYAAAQTAPRGVSSDVLRDRPQREAAITRVNGSVAHHSSLREIEFGFALARTTDEFQQLQANGIALSLSHDASMNLMFAPRVRIGDRLHRIRLAATAARGWRHSERWRNDGGQRGPRFARDDLHPTTATIQVEDSFALGPRLNVNMGLARLMARRKILDRSGNHSAYAFSSDRTLPQASARWDLSRDVALHGGVITMAEPPTYDDLIAVVGPYPSLRRVIQPLAMQRSLTYEFGARGRVANFSWDAAVYHAAWRNEILRLADATGAARGAVNASPTTHVGIETSVRWRLMEHPVRVSLVASSTWSRGRFEHDPLLGNGALAGMPPRMGNFEGLAEFPRGLFTAIGADWIGGTTYVDHARQLAYGGRTQVHARSGWRLGKEWSVSIDARNLFDRRSIASTAGVLDVARNPAATSIFLPAPGRSVSLVLTRRQ